MSPADTFAEGIEVSVWEQYTLRYGGSGLAVTAPMRQEALRRALKRVLIGEDRFEFSCEWKG